MVLTIDQLNSFYNKWNISYTCDRSKLNIEPILEDAKGYGLEFYIYLSTVLNPDTVLEDESSLTDYYHYFVAGYNRARTPQSS